jgi:hypothetical protein
MNRRKILGRLAVLVLPVVAAMSVAGPANAVPDINSASAAGSSPRAGVVSSVSNFSGNPVGFGVMRLWKGEGGIYDAGLYDAILPVGQRTEVLFQWPQTEGVYVDAGYCVDLVYLHDGVLTYHHTETGPKQVHIPVDIPDFPRFWQIYVSEC